MGRREETRGIGEAFRIAKRAVMGTRLELLLEVATASFEGQRAELAKAHAQRVARAFHARLQGFGAEDGELPIAATFLAVGRYGRRD